MAPVAEVSNRKTLPDRIERALMTGETIYHSAAACHVSNKFPDGKWVAQVRRMENSKLVKYPVKGFGTPKEALDYVLTLRPNARGRVSAPRQGEATVSDLYEFVKKHRQKKIGERTKEGKESRWRLYIEPEWGTCAISQVTRRSAQEWITEVEAKIRIGQMGTLGLAQLEKVRTDLHAIFEALDSFSPDYDNQKNPFAGLEFSSPPPRAKVTIESPFFGAICYACEFFADEGHCTEWIAEMFQTSLLGGLREGEVLALCEDQIDFENGAITIDRAMRRNSRAIDPKTRLEVGPILRQAMNYPKAGSATNNKTRVVPMSNQLAKILKKAISRRAVNGSEWNLIWPSESGKMRELTRFRSAWHTLKEKLDEVAKLAPVNIGLRDWPEVPKRPGWPRNPLISIARSDAKFRLPDLFGDIDFRDTRNSFASYMNEVGLSQATREQTLGHNGGLTNTVYTVVTSTAFQDAKKRLTNGWNS